MVERRVRNAEVRGSNPLGSTKWTLYENLLLQRRLCDIGGCKSKQRTRVKALSPDSLFTLYAFLAPPAALRTPAPVCCHSICVSLGLRNGVKNSMTDCGSARSYLSCRIFSFAIAWFSQIFNFHGASVRFTRPFCGVCRCCISRRRLPPAGFSV